MEEEYKLIDNVICTPSTKEQLDLRGIGWVYYECLMKNKNRVAQIDGITGEEDTFSSLLQRCVRTAVALKSVGVQYGDVISLCTYNHLNSCVPHISSMFIGAKIAALDPSLFLSHAVHLFKIIMPKVIFVGIESVKLIEDVISAVGSKTTVVVFGPTDAHISFSDFAKPRSREGDFRPTTAKSVRDVALILFSSGTSGLSKGICHTHFSYLRGGSAVMDLATLASVMYSSATPFWNVYVYYLNHSIQQGVARVVYPRSGVVDVWSIFKHKVTMAFFNLTEMNQICTTPKPDNIDLSSLKLVITAGGVVGADLIKKARMCLPGIFIRINYGQSEVFQTITSFDVTKPKHIELMEKKIVDVQSGKTLGPNQKGELLIKTDRQLYGYYNLKSDDIWDEDGWLKTGDYGYYDEDCCFYIVDRIKEMFPYKAWHFIPAIVETILLTFPGVFRVVVIGIPHATDENHAMAIVQLNEKARVSEADIVKFVDERVDHRQKLRAGVKFVNELPLTPSGKVNRWELKQMVMSGQI